MLSRELARLGDKFSKFAHRTSMITNKTKLKLDNQDIIQAVADLNIDLVLTAHPTEVTRRTLIHKHSELAKCLTQVHQPQLSLSLSQLYWWLDHEARPLTLIPNHR